MVTICKLIRNSSTLAKSLIKGLRNREIYKATRLLDLCPSNPQEISLLGEKAVLKAKEMVTQVKYSDSNDVAIKLDEISNELCRVADPICCLIYNHDDPRIVASSEKTHSDISVFVEQLNCDVDLYHKLKESQTLIDQSDHETLALTQSLLQDFESSGIHLGHKKIQDLLHLHCEIMEDCSYYHKSSYHHASSGISSQMDILAKILRNRSKYAHILGYSSYSDYSLLKSMARTTENVVVFLNKLIDKIIKYYYQNSKLSRPHLSVYSLEDLQKLTNNRDCIFGPISLERIFDVLNNVLKQVFEIEFVVDSDSRYYVWNSSIIKVFVKMNSEIIGNVYLDLFSRKSKTSPDCHYTLFGRKLSNDLQLPSVYLSLNLTLFDYQGVPSLMSNNVSTLFHEIGHCLHSMLYRGIYQHLSGTRCYTDVAEIPSTLFENFLSDPEVISQLCPFLDRDQIIQISHSKQNISYGNILKSAIDSLVDINLHKNIDQYQRCDEAIDSIISQIPIMKSTGNAESYKSFTHFIHYPCKYYSYLWAEAHANILWNEVFQQKTYNNIAGNLITEHLLSTGAIYDGHQIMQQLLNREVTIDEIVTNLL